jgi:hypothetical protein
VHPLGRVDLGLACCAGLFSSPREQLLHGRRRLQLRLSFRNFPLNGVIVFGKLDKGD